MIRTRIGPMIPVEFFERFILTGDERYIQLFCKICKSTKFADIEWWGQADLTQILFEAGEHKCPKPAPPVEDSSMTNVEVDQIRDAAVATGKFQRTEKTFQSKGNPYANLEREAPTTVTPKVNPNVL